MSGLSAAANAFGTSLVIAVNDYSAKLQAIDALAFEWASQDTDYDEDTEAEIRCGEAIQDILHPTPSAADQDEVLAEIAAEADGEMNR